MPRWGRRARAPRQRHTMWRARWESMKSRLFPKISWWSPHIKSINQIWNETLLHGKLKMHINLSISSSMHSENRLRCGEEKLHFNESKCENLNYFYWSQAQINSQCFRVNTNNMAKLFDFTSAKHVERFSFPQTLSSPPFAVGVTWSADEVRTFNYLWSWHAWRDLKSNTAED